MSAVIRPSFAKGEISPSLYGRVDTSLYQVALRKAYNTIIRPYGGATTRPGLQWVGYIGDHSNKAYLIDFEFSTVDQYILEFGPLTMRVIRDGAYVLNATKTITGATKANPCVITANSHGFSNGDEVYITSVGGMTELNGRTFIVANKATNTFELTDPVSGANVNSTNYTTYTSGGTAASIYTLTTPYAVADLPSLKYVQSADVMTLVHKDYAPRTLTRTDHNVWTLSTIDNDPVTASPTNIAITKGDLGGASARYTVTAIGDDESLPGTNATSLTITGATKADPCVITFSGTHNLDDGDNILITSVSGMTELNNRRFNIKSASSTTVQLVDEDSTGYTTYSSGGTAKRTFDYAELNNITNINKATWGIVTLADGHGIKTGDEMAIDGVNGMTQVNGRRFLAGSVTSSTVELLYEDTVSHSTYTSGGSIWPVNSARNTITWTAVPDAKRYYIYKEQNGLFGKIGESTSTSYTDENDLIDLSISPPVQNLPFRLADLYPGAVGYYEQRKVLGGSVDYPSTSYYTRVGTESNHSNSIPIQADDAFDATISARKANEIRWYVPQDDLLMFTSSSEWKVSSGTDTAFGPATVRQKLQSEYGCSDILHPHVVGRSVIFAGDNDVDIRTMGYSLTLDGYTGINLNLLSEHLFRNKTVVSWAWSHSPEGRLYAVRSDGVLLTMTFDEEQEVIAWTSWETDGWFENVQVLSHDDSSVEDEVYVIVKRMIGGNVVRSVEKLGSTFYEHLYDGMFLDFSLTYDVPVAITGATAANPVVITAVAHGFSNGDEVDISDIIWEPDIDSYGGRSQPAQLNGSRYTVANKTTDTFELSGVDGSAFNAYESGGYVRKAVTTLSGLWHLEGETVTIVANGTVTTDTVASGALTLGTKASRVHIGLPYISEVELLDIEVPGGRTAQGKYKTVGNTTLRFERSKGVIIGANSSRMVPVKESAFKEAAVNGLYTGDIEVNVKNDWNTNGRLLIRQKNPYPMTLLAVIPDYEAEDA